MHYKINKIIYPVFVLILTLCVSTKSILAQDPGNALDFDGSNDYVTIPDAAALDITDQITIEGWFKSASSSWLYKKLVTIDYTKVLATQSNFPVLVSVTDTDLLDTDNSGSIQPDGDDILFMGTDGTKYPHEIEEYDGSTGKLIAWVRVPTLSSVANTEFYLYYGNPGCASQQDASGVWSNNYNSVHHLDDNDASGTTIFEEDFENTADWDAKWDGNGTTSWTQASDFKNGGTYSTKSLNGNEGFLTSDDIDASTASYIIVDFWIRKDAVETNDVNLYYYNGTSYNKVARLDTLGADNTWLRFYDMVDDAQYLKSNFRIRFETSLTPNEYVWIDDLKITADGPNTLDSSPNNKTGTKFGAPVETTAGYISNAQSFDGDNDYVALGDVIDSPTAITLSAWVKHNNLTNTIERHISLANRFVIRHEGTLSQGSLDFYIRRGTPPLSEHIRVNGVLSNDTWYYITGTWDGTESKLYCDGQVLDSLTNTITPDDPAYGFISQSTETMNGFIDEVRISSVARDSSWIATEYNNMSSPGTFLSMGSPVYVGVAGKSTAYGIGTDNSIAYATINDQTLTGSITASEWNHIAFTYNKDAGGTDEMKLYINGTQSATGDYATAITTNNDNMIFGNLVGFLGNMDEVRLWNDVRTEKEIRDNMHRLVDPASANLVGYWQFNESSGTSAADSAGTNTGTLNNMTDADWVASTGPFGGGLVEDTTSFTSGTSNLGTFSLTTTDAFDAAVDITATEILNAPNILPAAPDSLDDRYWVVDVFGTPGTYTANLTFTLPDGYLTLGEEANMKLYRRSSNSDGSWSLAVDGAASITATTVTFNGVSTLGQFTMAGNSGFPLPVELTSFTADFYDGNVMLYWTTATEVNNYGFEVQRSVMDDEWDVIGFVQGHGNSNSPKQYEFTDDLSTLPDYEKYDEINYRLKQIDIDGKFEIYGLNASVDVSTVTGIEDENMPEEYELFQNYPNPFNPASTIKIGLPESGSTLLEIYNAIGQKVATLINKELPAGYHEVEWNASGFPSGIYLYRISTKNYTDVKKMMLLK